MRAWLAAACLLAGCGASATDAGPPDANLAADSGGAPDSKPNVAPIAAELVLVDGVSQGNALDATLSPFTVDDVRVCIFDASNTAALFEYALPDNVFLPQTNIAGIHRGGAIDLGTAPGSSIVTLDIFSANDLRDDTASTQDRTNYTCKAMTCTLGTTCRPHVVIPNVAIAAGKINVVALLDDTNATTVIAKQSAFDDPGYSGAPNSIYGGLVNHSSYGGTNDVNVYFGTSDGSEPNQGLWTPITRDQAQPPMQVASDDTGVLDSLGLRADAINGQQPASRFWQSLDSIAFVSDESVDPKTFYDVRKNFVIALVGDPKDTTSVAKNGGRDPNFDGRGLHFVAVAYSTSAP